MDLSIAQQIKDYVVGRFLPGQPTAAALTTSSPLIETGLIDSMALVVLVGWLEQHFQVQIDPGDILLENFNSIDRIATLVEGYQGR